MPPISQWISAPDVRTRRVSRIRETVRSWLPPSAQSLVEIGALVAGATARMRRATARSSARAEARRAHGTANAPSTAAARCPSTSASNNGDSFHWCSSQSSVGAAAHAWMLATMRDRDPVGLWGAKSTPCSAHTRAIGEHPGVAAAVLDVGHQHVVELAGAHRLRRVGAGDRLAAGRAHAALVRERGQARDRAEAQRMLGDHALDPVRPGGRDIAQQRFGAIDVEAPVAVDHDRARPRRPRRAPRTRGRARRACARRSASAPHRPRSRRRTARA